MRSFHSKLVLISVQLLLLCIATFANVSPAIAAVIGVAVTASPDPVAPGQKLLYTITVTYQDSVTRFFTVTAPVPAHTTVAAASQRPASTCDGGFPTTCQAGQLLFWTLGGIAAGGSTTVQFTAEINPSSAPPRGTLIWTLAIATNNAGSNASVTKATPFPFNLTAANIPPVADAGTNQTVNIGTLVTLDGRASNDPDAGPSPLTFAWRQTSGPGVLRRQGLELQRQDRRTRTHLRRPACVWSGRLLGRKRRKL